MPKRISKVQRWLDLITYLVTRHFPVPVEELMERLPAYAVDWAEGSDTARESVRRKFERDKDELRAFGIPLETVTYSINRGLEEAQGYRLSKKNFYLPYLKLLKEGGPAATAGQEGSAAAGEPGFGNAKEGPTEGATAGLTPPLSENLELFHLAPDGSIEVREEVVADAVWGLKELADVPGFPLATQARSAYRKFTFDLDPQPSPQKHVFFVTPPETARAEAHLEVLTDALLRRKKVTFPYHGIERNQLTERVVHPYGLLFKNSHWYLVGWDETRDAERVFRVDRMESVEVNPASPATPDYEMPERPVLEAYRDRQAWELGEVPEPVQALVRFQFPTSLWAHRNRYGEKVGEADDGSALRRFEVHQPDPFVRWILSLEGQAVIEDPPELQEALLTMARQVADLYRENADA
ncbi:MAG: WYL domain-containing protein [Gemmatimonadota bacterium]|jgi:predicted DNA-binding transcriptional regulator YafY